MPKLTWGRDLYVISCGEITKLGRSQHPQKRLQEVARGMPWSPCRLWAVFPDAGFLEAGLHRQLSGQFERRGEWYKVGPEVIARLAVAHLTAVET